MSSSSTPLSEYLRSCREQVAPEDVGLPRGPRRRTPGLRRQEVAQLAGVSVEYLARLEQARAGRPSAEVLDAIADALGLDNAQCEHLRRLGGHASQRGRAAQSETLGPRTRRLLELVEPMPAIVLGRWMDLLAANGPAIALMGDPAALPAEQRNVVRRLFRDPEQRRLHPDWPTVTAEIVAALRGRAARQLDDPELTALVDDLSSDPLFHQLWADNQIRDHGVGTKRFIHPHVGALELTYQTLEVTERHGQMFVLFTAEPGSSSAEAVLRLDRGKTAHAAATPSSHT